MVDLNGTVPGVRARALNLSVLSVHVLRAALMLLAREVVLSLILTWSNAQTPWSVRGGILASMTPSLLTQMAMPVTSRAWVFSRLRSWTGSLAGTSRKSYDRGFVLGTISQRANESEMSMICVPLSVAVDPVPLEELSSFF